MVLILLALVLLTGASVVFHRGTRLSGPAEWSGAADDPGTDSLYEYFTRSLEGVDVSLADHRGQVALVVNVASRCGLTKQYEGLQGLHEELSPRGFIVLAFPSNDFLNQEPGDAEDIREFCTVNFRVTFPIFAKRVVSGAEKDEIYRFLSRDLEEPSWNFTKYLVARDGRVLARFAPDREPGDGELRASIEAALDA